MSSRLAWPLLTAARALALDSLWAVRSGWLPLDKDEGQRVARDEVLKAMGENPRRLAQFGRASGYGKSRTKDQSALRLRIRDLAHIRPRFRSQRIWVLLRREGWLVNPSGSADPTLGWLATAQAFASRRSPRQNWKH
ncbi:MAG: hypothetical protein MRJ68_17575 [Nitrospira sp.]|nr:hypothetical protein [Nitrospira sp.]